MEEMDSNKYLGKSLSALLSPTARRSQASSRDRMSIEVTMTPISVAVNELEQIEEEFRLIEQDIVFDGAQIVGDGATGQVYKQNFRDRYRQ